MVTIRVTPDEEVNGGYYWEITNEDGDIIDEGWRKDLDDAWTTASENFTAYIKGLYHA